VCRAAERCAHISAVSALGVGSSKPRAKVGGGRGRGVRVRGVGVAAAGFMVAADMAMSSL